MKTGSLKLILLIILGAMTIFTVVAFAQGKKPGRPFEYIYEKIQNVR